MSSSPNTFHLLQTCATMQSERVSRPAKSIMIISSGRRSKRANTKVGSSSISSCVVVLSNSIPPHVIPIACCSRVPLRFCFPRVRECQPILGRKRPLGLRAALHTKASQILLHMFFRVASFVLVLAALSLASLENVAWKPTSCGPANQITQWGKEVNPASVLPEYPRPQMRRPEHTWKNLNGLWQFEPAQPNQAPPFGRQLSQSILVPFPVESCLSGIGLNYRYLWYRLVFDLPSNFDRSGRVLLHFGAVDWQTTVWFQRQNLGNHTGGYDGFSFDLTHFVQPTNNELIVYVYDPSDTGYQPNGKQRISAIVDPGGDTYTPSSGIWQTVWLENVPKQYITNVTILANMTTLTVSANVVPATPGVTVTFRALDGSRVAAVGSAQSGMPVTMVIPRPKLWDPESPFLYDLFVGIPGDSVMAYFGMRSVSLGHYMHPPVPDTGIQIGVDRPGSDMPGYPVVLPSADPHLCWDMCKKTSGCVSWAYAVPRCAGDSQPYCWLKNSVPGSSGNACRVSGVLAMPSYQASRPFINDRFLFLAGWLDQSWWPDGQYTAPTERALLYDLQMLKVFGMNVVRLHQKINPERWYYHADRLGIVVLQDFVQKYGGASHETIEPFLHDAKAAIQGRYNHPCIIQWDVFNEFDCVGVFNATAVVQMVQKMDPSRLVDTNSGGPANDLHIADVNDVHTYPWPSDPKPSATQYAMQGEFGGIGAFIAGHEWIPKKCEAYLVASTPQEEADLYVQMAEKLYQNKGDVSVTIYTQITDVERECDGFLNYDRTDKFNSAQLAAIAAANHKLIHQ